MGVNRRIWYRLPVSVRESRPGRAYGRHLHGLVCRQAQRKQNHSTFFLRNRLELELVRRLLQQQTGPGSQLNLCVLACSKGAEVYSFLWALRSARPGLRISTQAIDISPKILEFAQRGVYSRKGPPAPQAGNHKHTAVTVDATWQDQPLSIFERMSHQEMEAMFELEKDEAKIRPWLREGISWAAASASDPGLADAFGPQDIVVANRFLCHMEPLAAEGCLRNIARLVKPGGHLFVSGVDLDVRTKVALELGWKPVTDLMKEVHEGDISLKNGWPLEWWGLEPFSTDLPDWRTRYATVFQIGLPLESCSLNATPDFSQA